MKDKQFIRNFLKRTRYCQSNSKVLIVVANVFVADDAVSDAPNGSKRYVMTIMAGATGLSVILLRSVIRRFDGSS
jgi:hypothetical protein